MLKFHMPQAIVKPRKTLGSELTVLILAQRYAVRVAVSVTACGMTVQILHSVKAPGFATRNVAFDGAAMGLEMLRELTSSQEGLRTLRAGKWRCMLGCLASQFSSALRGT